MRRRHQILGTHWLLPLSLSLFACASTEKSQGLTKVDDLLTRVEQVQIECVVAREKASAAFDAFGQIVAPNFEGEPMAAFNDLVMKIKASKDQAQKLENCVLPMKETAETVFLSWTKDLEKFGNTNLRQASQARLAETRSRYSAVHDAATAALVSINAFNSDLNDQALFLEHDFNMASVSVIAMQVPALTNEASDLGKRLNVCAATAKAYITAGALRGQVGAPPTPGQPEVAAQKPASPPLRKLPNPMAEDGVQPGATAQETPPSNVAPAHRRPRGDGAAAAPVQAPPPAPATQPVGAAPGGTPNTLPTSLTPAAKPLPSLPEPVARPETDLTPKPAPAPNGQGGNGGGN
jgi:hypothetical protein